MGFLKRLFGGGDDKPKKYVDKDGIYFFVKAHPLRRLCPGTGPQAKRLNEC